MNKSITPNQIKQNNKSLIYHYIYQNPKVSQQDIAYDLRLSRPTITTNLNALEADGFIQRDGQITTESAGRKAVAYSIISDYRVAIGVEILKQSIKIIIGKFADSQPFSFQNVGLYVITLAHIWQINLMFCTLFLICQSSQTHVFDIEL